MIWSPDSQSADTDGWAVEDMVTRLTADTDGWAVEDMVTRLTVYYVF